MNTIRKEISMGNTMMGPQQPTFIDLFSGCGGLSLGLMKAGWEGLFAIEQSPVAFRTLQYNLIDENGHNVGKPKFTWPDWIDIGPHEISSFVKSHKKDLKQLRGEVHLVAGGPPCQGFSFAGKRSPSDPRNELFKHHINVVNILKPELVLLENVQGIDTAHGEGQKRESRKRGRPRKSYASRISYMLDKQGYDVQQHIIRAVDFGVPQFRPRYFTLGIRKDLVYSQTPIDIYKELHKRRSRFLKKRGLPTSKPVTVSEALSDLTTVGKKLVCCTDKDSPPGYSEIVYEGPLTRYQELMHDDMNGQALNSLRLVNHRPESIERFVHILESCRKGVAISKSDRDRLGIKKSALVPLAPDQPSHTLTTIPDDMIHYSEPRIHTVREHARLQSFPDWFEFQGKFTTGGNRRIKECPRYTQVGNAVPPLLAEALGETLIKVLHNLESTLTANILIGKSNPYVMNDGFS